MVHSRERWLRIVSGLVLLCGIGTLAWRSSYSASRAGMSSAPESIEARLTSEEKALETLDDGLASPTERLQAANFLSKRGASAVEHLCELLNAADPSTRRFASISLGQIGPEANQAVPRLIELTVSLEIPVRSAALEAIGRIAPESRKVLESVIRSLNSSNSGESLAATETLCRLARIATPFHDDVLNALRRQLDSPLPSIRAAAIAGLANAVPPCIDDLVQSLSNRDQTVRIQAAIAFGGMRRSAAPGIAKLVHLTTAADKAESGAARGSLRRLGAQVLPELLTVVESSAPIEERTEAAIFSAMSGVPPQPLILVQLGEGARKLGSDGCWWARIELALRQTNELGRPLIRELSASSEAQHARDLAETFERRRGRGKALIQDLIAELRHPSSLVRERAAWSIGCLRRDGISAADALYASMRDPDPKVRKACRWAFEQIDAQLLPVRMLGGGLMPR